MPNQAMKELPIFAAFNVMSISAKEDKDSIVLTATGHGTGNAQAAIDQLTSMKDFVMPDLLNQVKQIKDLSPVIDALESIKSSTDRSTAGDPKVTATISQATSREAFWSA